MKRKDLADLNRASKITDPSPIHPVYTHPYPLSRSHLPGIRRGTSRYASSPLIGKARCKATCTKG